MCLSVLRVYVWWNVTNQLDCVTHIDRIRHLTIRDASSQHDSRLCCFFADFYLIIIIINIEFVLYNTSNTCANPKCMGYAAKFGIRFPKMESTSCCRSQPIDLIAVGVNVRNCLLSKQQNEACAPKFCFHCEKTL